MTQVESVSVALSLLLGLGLALVLTSGLTAFRARRDVQLDAVPIAWTVYIFVSQLQYWWGPVFLLNTLPTVSGPAFANTYECEGRYDEAIPIYEKAVELSGQMPFITAFLGGAYARSNRVDEARAIWRELFEKAQKDPNLQMWVAHVHEALGETEKALTCLERAYEARSPFLQLIGTEWLRFESVRDHPRFTKLRDKMGLSGDAVVSQSR